MGEFKKAGVETYAFLGPLLPYISEEGIEELLDELAEKAGRIIIDRLNIKAGNFKPIRHALSAHYPDLKPMFESALTSDSQYYLDLKTKVATMCSERGIPYFFCY